MASTDEERIVTHGLMQTNAAMAQQILHLQHELNTVTRERDELKRQVEEAHMRYEALVRDKLKPLQAQVKELQRQLERKDQEIAALTNTIQMLQGSIRELQDSNRTLESSAQDLAERLAIQKKEHDGDMTALRAEMYELLNATPEASERESKLQSQLEESKSRERKLERDMAKAKVTIAFLRAGSFSKFTQRYIVKRCLPDVNEEAWKRICTLTVAQLANTHDSRSSVPADLRALIPTNIVEVLERECRGAGFRSLAVFKSSCWIIADARQRFSAHAPIDLDTVRQAAATLTNSEEVVKAYPEDNGSIVAAAICTGNELNNFIRIMTGIYGEGHAEALDEFEEYPSSQ